MDGYEWAKGTVPTPPGYVSVEWQRGGSLRISGPKGQMKRVILPGREEILSEDEEIVVEL